MIDFSPREIVREIVDFSSLMETLKKFNHYYPDHNFHNVLIKLISKKVIHTNKISLLVSQVYKIKQTKQRNLI